MMTPTDDRQNASLSEADREGHPSASENAAMRPSLHLHHTNEYPDWWWTLDSIDGPRVAERELDDPPEAAYAALEGRTIIAVGGDTDDGWLLRLDNGIVIHFVGHWHNDSTAGCTVIEYRSEPR
jgi:hypothetical protein